VEGAIQSAILSTIFALSILICLTKRVLSSIFVAFQISCVVVSVLGVFVLLGWELNVIESIITAVSVGLACDFAAHLAHSFNDEKPETLESQVCLVLD
jgi:predicted RND superfamily exporter protein